MKVLFLHGYGSQPGGLKPGYLRDHGHEVVNPALPSEDFDRSVEIAQEAFDRARPDVVVGSSRGGAVALNMHTADVPRVLIAPAWKKWGKATTVNPPVTVLHSPHDELVPIDDSRELLSDSGLPEAHLLVGGEDHTMSDERALAMLLAAIEKAAEKTTS